MDAKPVLLRTLQAAWEVGVANDHRFSQFGSERALQASFYFHLRTLLAPGALVFVEPRVVLAERTIVPDLCVVADGEAWLVELKLQNAVRQGIIWETDFKKFGDFAASSKGEVQLEGRADFKAVSLPAERYFLFAAVGDSTCGALTPEWLRSRAADHLRDAVPKTYWSGGYTDKKHFVGPQLLTR